MSSQPAYIPLFGNDYLGDTMHLTTEEHGAYFLLMIAAWRQDDCGLPYDDRKLAKIVRLPTRRWDAIKETILEFWTVEEGRIFQPRLRKEWNYARQKSEANRKSASARWSKQATENIESGSCKRTTERNAPQPQPQVEEEPKGSPSQSVRATEASLGEFEPDPVPTFTPDDLWRMWNRAAEELGLPKVREMTDARRKRALTMIGKYGRDGFVEAISAIERSTFLRGQTDQQFKADLDFLLQQKSFTRLIEGFYDRSSRANSRSRYEPDGAMAYLQRSLGIEGGDEPSGSPGRWDGGGAEGGHRLSYSGD